jgi:hypothetical protein
MAATRKTTAKKDTGAKAPKQAKRVAKPREPKAEIIRPMSDELFEEICERIANGSSLLRLEKEDGFPSRTTMWKWIAATEERRAAYDQAREDRADYRVDLIDGIVAKLNNGTIEPNAGRVMIDAIKWQASKENRAVYGEQSRVDLNVSQSPLSDLSDEELDKRILQFMEGHDLARLTAPREG